MRGLFAGLWIMATIVAVASQESDPTTTTTFSVVEDAVEDTIAQETIAEGRGERDEIGVREEWESTHHIGEKHDSRRPISAKVQRLLTTYRLECEGCDNNEATRIVNEFVRTAQREAELEEERKAIMEKWLARLNHPWAIRLGFVCLACNLLLLAYLCLPENEDAAILKDNLRSAIELQQQRAAAEERLERAAQESRPAAPSWIENEENEVWTAKQEKQFAKALREFGGVGKKERYQLIADKVVEKTKLECLMHHKLFQVKEKEHSE